MANVISVCDHKHFSTQYAGNFSINLLFSQSEKEDLLTVCGEKKRLKPACSPFLQLSWKPTEAFWGSEMPSNHVGPYILKFKA